MWSSMLVCSTIRIGWSSGRITTAVPTLIRLVRPSTYPAIVNVLGHRP
jgi:hypothetical protein